jgi:hypothetical protein
MNKQKTKRIWKNVYMCLACGFKSFRYSVVHDHLQLYHPEVYCHKNWKSYIVMYRRIRYDQYLDRKQIAKTIKAIKGKVKMPLRMYL